MCICASGTHAQSEDEAGNGDGDLEKVQSAKAQTFQTPSTTLKPSQIYKQNSGVLVYGLFPHCLNYGSICKTPSWPGILVFQRNILFPHIRMYCIENSLSPWKRGGRGETFPMGWTSFVNKYQYLLNDLSLRQPMSIAYCVK